MVLLADLVAPGIAVAAVTEIDEAAGAVPVIACGEYGLLDVGMAIIVHCDVRLADEPDSVVDLLLENRAGAVGVVVAVVPELGGHAGLVVDRVQECYVLHYRAARP